jgi:hypothetical protein
VPNLSVILRRSRALQSAFFLLLILLAGCGSETSSFSNPTNVVPKGLRTLGIDALAGTNLQRSLQAAQSVGAQSVTQLVTWTMIETGPHVYNTIVLQPISTLLPQQGMSVSLMIAVINTTVKDMPPDLTGLPFDDPTVISRFEALLDQIFAALPNTQLLSLGIGNEVDSYLDSAVLWMQYKNFYNTVAAYAHVKRPGTRIGVEGTLHGALGTWQSQFATLTTNSDVYMFSYYPLNADFTVKDPSTVSSDIEALAAAYAGKPIEIREAGYPTSSVINSSEEKQAAFVDNMFAVWDKYPGEIEFVCFTRLNDESAAAVLATAAYYGISDPNFIALLESLGLRTVDQVEKAGFVRLRQDSTARGW